MRNLLIIQNIVPHYRKALYNELSEYYRVTVLHSGAPSVGSDDRYSEVISPAIRFGGIYLQKGVLSEVRKAKYDVVIAMFDVRWIMNILVMYLHKKDTKFIWWGAWLTDSKIANALRVHLSHKNYASIFYTENAKSEFIECGVEQDKLFVANNTFDIKDRVDCYLAEEKDSILFVGSLDVRKKIDVLIDSFRAALPEIPEHIRLVIVGDGDERVRLQKKVKDQNLVSRVKFEGKVTDTKKLVEFYKKAIVSVSPGQAGLSVLQSMGYGVPFMTHKEAISGGEITNIVNGVNGFLIDDNSTSFQTNLVGLCNNVDKAREYGRNAFEYYSSYCTINNMVNGFRSAISYGFEEQGL